MGYTQNKNYIDKKDLEHFWVAEAINTKQDKALSNEVAEALSGDGAEVHTLDDALLRLNEKAGTGGGGEPGFSPTVEVTKTGKVTTVTITDKTGAHTATINDGEDGTNGTDGAKGDKGEDGVSPTISAVRVSNGVQLTITDKNGSHSAVLNDGIGDGSTVATFADVPSDGKSYLRQNGIWVEGATKAELAEIGSKVGELESVVLDLKATDAEVFDKSNDIKVGQSITTSAINNTTAGTWKSAGKSTFDVTAGEAIDLRIKISFKQADMTSDAQYKINLYDGSLFKGEYAYNNNEYFRVSITPNANTIDIAPQIKVGAVTQTIKAGEGVFNIEIGEGYTISIKDDISIPRIDKAIASLNTEIVDNAKTINALSQQCGEPKIIHSPIALEWSANAYPTAYQSVGSSAYVNITTSWNHSNVTVSAGDILTLKLYNHTSTNYSKMVVMVDENDKVVALACDSLFDNAVHEYQITIPNGVTMLHISNYAARTNQTTCEITKSETLQEQIDALVDGGGEDAKVEKAIKAQIDSKRPMIIELNRTKKLINFVQITDTHLSEYEKSGSLDLRVANQIASEKWLDFVCHTGDLIDYYKNRETSTTEFITISEALQRFDDNFDYLKNINIPLLITRGNHDSNYSGQNPDRTQNTKVTNTEFMMMTQNNFFGSVINRKDVSFCKDFDNVRVIMLDVYPNVTATTAFTNEQILWLYDNLKTNKAVVVLAHTLENMISDFYEMISAFKSGTAKTLTTSGISVDFISQGAGDFVACICGHTHSETEDNSNGIWVITSDTSLYKRSSIVANNIYATCYSIDVDAKKLYRRKLGNGGQSKVYDWQSLIATNI